MTANRGRTTIRIREDLLEWLKDIAYLQDKTLSQVLNEAVECYIEKKKAENREALLKAREVLEQLRKLKENTVNEANGIEKNVVGVKNEYDENREALIKARQYLEEVRKRRAQASQASSPVNEANEVDEVDAEGEE